MDNAYLELDDDYLNDGPVECAGCGETFPASAPYGDGKCFDCSLAARFTDGCEVEVEDDIPGSDGSNDWMTDKRKSEQFMHAMDIILERRMK